MGEEKELERKVVEAFYQDGKVYARLGSASQHYLSRGYGVREEDLVTYSPVEALYLVEEGRMRVRDEEGKELGFNQLLQKLSSKNSSLWRDYVVYRDLRKRRYVVKDGFGLELRFRVFERGEYREKPAKYLIAPVYEGSNVGMEKVIEWLETCKNMRKELVLAVIDRRNEVIYYGVKIVDLIP